MPQFGFYIGHLSSQNYIRESFHLAILPEASIDTYIAEEFIWQLCPDRKKLGTGVQVGTLAVARVSGTGMLYQEALENLWGNYEKDHGPREYKKIALVNVHYDTDILNLILYTEVMLFIRTDVVEFN